jgi:bla regulator protein blaR1
MIVYLLKVILSATLFFVLYKSLLEHERMFIFNRFYLLTTLVLSFFIPIITIESKTSLPAIVQATNIEYIIDTPQASFQNIINKNTTAYDYGEIMIVLIYILISLLLLYRFCKNLYGIHKKIISHEIVLDGKRKLVLCNDSLTAHSFLNYVFIQKDEYLNGEIRPEIIRHECTHVQQKHSLDIIFIEFLQVFCWFNPLIKFYSNAIKLNHEFLADAAVIKKYNNHSSYQALLLSKASANISQKVTSQFNYLITKKRLIMITKTSTTRDIIMKLAIVIPALVLSIFLLSEKTFAQIKTEQPIEKIITYGDGATQEQLNEYDATLKNMTSVRILKNGKKSVGVDMAKCDADRMTFIFMAMNKVQREVRVNATGITWEQNVPPARQEPTQSQLQDWKDSKKYGVWIDEKRINNNDLAKYKPEDFGLFYNSKLEKNAVNYGKHSFQISLYSNDYYSKWLIKVGKSRLMFVKKNS